MSKILFTSAQIKKLSKNVWIKNITEKAITYTDEFKIKLVKETKDSKKIAREIFEECDIEPDIIGMSRIYNSLKRWKNQYQKTAELRDTRKGASGRPRIIELSESEKLKRAEAKIKLLEAENELLKKNEMIELGLLKDIKSISNLKWLKENNIPIMDCEIFSLYDKSMLKPENSLKDTIKKYFPNDFQNKLFIIKPTISARSNNTFLINPFNIRHQDLMNLKITENCEEVFQKLLKKFRDRGLIIQIYCEDVKNGEQSLVFLNGICVQGILEVSSLLYNQEKRTEIMVPSRKLMEFANKIIKKVSVEKAPIIRIDTVLDGDSYKVLELEMAEPNIYIRATDKVGLKVYGPPEKYISEIIKLGCKNKKLIKFAKNIVERING